MHPFVRPVQPKAAPFPLKGKACHDRVSASVVACVGMIKASQNPLAAAPRRLWSSLTTAPDAGGWGFTALAASAAFAAMAIIGFSGGLYRLGSLDLAGLPARLIGVFLVPALSEEAVFRGLFIPDRSERPGPWATLAVVTAVFTLWHGIETLFLKRAAPIFLRSDFLACAAILGLACGLVRWRTASLWPAVALHWAAVVVWQTALGGPELKSLR